jgi:hypothetical protein
MFQPGMTLPGFPYPHAPAHAGGCGCANVAIVIGGLDPPIPLLESATPCSVSFPMAKGQSGIQR